MDATILAAARLSHISYGGLNHHDIAGYAMCIVLHTMAVSLQLLATWLTFAYTVEMLEDPYEHASFGLLEDVLKKATDKTKFLNETKLESGIYLNSDEIKFVIELCMECLQDVEYAHLVFLFIFLGIVICEVFKTLWRLKIIFNLPNFPDDKADSDSSDTDGEERESMYPHASLKNSTQEHHFIRFMSPFWKGVMFVVFFIHGCFLSLVFWTFAKWLVLLHDIVKVAKMCLKLGFLLKFVKNVFDGFAAPSIRKVIGDGGFKIPKPHKVTFSYIWGTWMSTVTKMFFASIFTYLIISLFFKNVLVLDNLCKAYAQAVTYPDFQNMRVSDRFTGIEDLF
jgi:hypothetical protein